MTQPLRAGAAAVEITPHDSQFLYGYPHVERYSTGVHDPLFSSALYLSDGAARVLFVANDAIFVTKHITARVRARIAAETGVPESAILVSASHTHSGPITVDYLSNEADPVVPKADPAYVAFFEDCIVEAATRSASTAEPAKIGLAVADATGVGTNRRDPAGPADPEVPVLTVRSADGRRPLACMLVCSMHPTVLHEDSTLVSADFPGMAREYLQREALGAECPVLCHTGPAGNQSPRHVTRGNTFAETERLGRILGRAVEKALADVEYQREVTIHSGQALIDLPEKSFPSVTEARRRLEASVRKLENLRAAGAPKQEVRTAECDWFGAEETVTLAQAAADGRLEAARRSCLPGEVQGLCVGPWSFVGWPGEVFVEYALAVKARRPGTFVISLANGELQGYVVTREATRQGGYEASNALFGPECGEMLVDTTLALLAGE